MEDIEAIYLASADNEALDDSDRIEKIIVLKDSIGYGSNVYSAMGELEQFFDQKLYEGNSIVTLPEAIAINKTTSVTDSPIQKVEIKTEDTFSDYHVVEEYNENYIVSISSYIKDELIYTFVKDGDEQGFLFYTIEAGEGGAE